MTGYVLHPFYEPEMTTRRSRRFELETTKLLSGPYELSALDCAELVVDRLSIGDSILIDAPGVPFAHLTSSALARTPIAGPDWKPSEKVIIEVRNPSWASFSLLGTFYARVPERP